MMLPGNVSVIHTVRSAAHLAGQSGALQNPVKITASPSAFNYSMT